MTSAKLALILAILIIFVFIVVLLTKVSVSRWRHYRDLRESWPLSHVPPGGDPTVSLGWWPSRYPSPRAFRVRPEDSKSSPPWRTRKANKALVEWNSAFHCRLYGRLCQRTTFGYSVAGELGILIGGATFGASIPGYVVAIGKAGFPWPLMATYASLVIAGVGVNLRLRVAPRWSRAARGYFARAEQFEQVTDGSEGAPTPSLDVTSAADSS